MALLIPPSPDPADGLGCLRQGRPFLFPDSVKHPGLSPRAAREGSRARESELSVSLVLYLRLFPRFLWKER